MKEYFHLIFLVFEWNDSFKMCMFLLCIFCDYHYFLEFGAIYRYIYTSILHQNNILISNFEGIKLME